MLTHFEILSMKMMAGKSQINSIKYLGSSPRNGCQMTRICDI